MTEIFNELVDSYQNYRLSAVVHGLFVDEAETFVRNVKRRIEQLQAEHGSRIRELESLLDGIDVPAEKATVEAEIAEFRDSPARATACELAAFEGIVHTATEAAAEVRKHQTAFCDAFASATAELDRLRRCYARDRQCAAQNEEHFPKIIECWGRIKEGMTE